MKGPLKNIISIKRDNDTDNKPKPEGDDGNPFYLLGNKNKMTAKTAMCRTMIINEFNFQIVIQLIELIITPN